MHLYDDLVALALCVMPDPVTALTFMKYLSSLLATVAIYFALSSFSKILRPGAIVFSCFIWIASSLNAPFLASTSVSLFAFGIMLLGIDCLLPGRSIKGLVGFYFFGLMTVLFRPEYFLPVALITFILMGRAVWSGSKWTELHLGWPRYWTCAGGACLAVGAGAFLWINPSAPLVERISGLDEYAFLGLGQCYADFYRREHPKEVFEPMTEYKAILDRTFNHPAGFCAAVRNNPLEVLRYFVLNGGNNLLGSVPRSLLDHYREQSSSDPRGFLWWFVRVILIAGALLGVVRLCRRRWKRADFSLGSIIASCQRNSTSRKLFLLLLLLSTSSVAIVLLVGSPRYFLCWAPLFYLGVACCVDSLLRAGGLHCFESLFVALSFILLCRPNYLAPRPHYEFDAVRHVAAYVKKYPTIGGWWSKPDMVIALKEKARAVNISDGIYQADIENGKIDILMLDANFRSTKTWMDQREFFEKLERQPEMYGLKKSTDIPTGRFDIYYKPDPAKSTGQNAL